MKTAAAQSQANTASARQEAVLNRYDSTTPFGSSTWKQDPNNPDKWSNSFQLDPKVQGMLDSYMAKSGQPLGQIDTSKLPAAGQLNTTSLPAGAESMTAYTGDLYRAGAEKQQSGYALDPTIAQSQAVTANSGDLANSSIDRLKQMYATEFNYDGAPAMPEANEAARKSIEDAYYGKLKSRLDPRFAEDEANMRSRLANQGLVEGSEAYNRELQQFMRGKNDAYSGATNDAILNSTGEMTKLFGMGLAARQQGVSEANYKRELGTREAQAAMGLYGGASSINNANFDTQRAIFDSAQQRAASQSAADWASKASAAQIRSGALTDQINQMNAQNTSRGNALNEQLAMKRDGIGDRNQLLNELMALTSGSQIQAPGSGPVGVQAAPIAQSIYNSYQGDLNNFNTAMASRNANIGMVGQAGMAAAMFF